MTDIERSGRFEKTVHQISDRFGKPTDDQIVERFLEHGIRTVVTVPCSITASIDQYWQELQLNRQMRVIRATHEGTLVGTSLGIQLGNGELPVWHAQNSGASDVIGTSTTLANIYDRGYLGIVTMRGFGEDSHPHVETAKITKDVVEILTDKKHILAAKKGRGFLKVLDEAVASAKAGDRTILLLGEQDFRKTHKMELIDYPEETPDEYEERQAWLWREKGRPYREVMSREPVSREDFFREVVEEFPDAAIFICNGYNSREFQTKFDRLLNVYSPGDMGGILGLAWGFALVSGMSTVAVDGDQNALRSVATFNVEDNYPYDLKWRIGNNRRGSSVGTAPSPKLPESFYKLAHVVRTLPDRPGSFKLDRVTARGEGINEELGNLPDLLKRFEHTVRMKQSERRLREERFSPLIELMRNFGQTPL